MVKETCISDILEQFRMIEEKFDVCIHLTKIFGERWAYVGGSKVEADKMGEHHRFKLNDQWGVIVWGEWKDEIKRAVLAAI